jgi:hypothetical protein
MLKNYSCIGKLPFGKTFSLLHYSHGTIVESGIDSNKYQILVFEISGLDASRTRL